MERTPQQLRQRRKLLILPLLTIPFIALTFWALGGGSGKAQGPDRPAGLNTSLPQARIGESPTDKLSLYNKAARDSMERMQLLRQDPYGFGGDTAVMPDTLGYNYGNASSPGFGGTYGSSLRGPADPNEAKVEERLRRLEQALSTPTETPALSGFPERSEERSVAAADLDRLESMIGSVTDPGGEDPELQQLSGMLEQILDIQHPERARQKLEDNSRRERGRAFAVSRPQEHLAADVMTSKRLVRYGRKIADTPVPVYEPLAAPGFYGLEKERSSDDIPTAIPAVIHETQTLVSGSTVKLRLEDDILVSGILVPKGNFVFGTCTITGERLKIDIPGLRYGKNLLPVSLQAYDLDALEGIRIPGAITREVSKDGADRMVQGVQLMSMDPSIGAQAAGAGVEIAKGLFSKKAKLIRVTVKAGYPVLLMDQKTAQELK